MNFRLRLFPLTIFTAVLLLSLKGGQFIDGLSTMSGSLQVAQSRAQSSEDAAETEDEADDEDTSDEEANLLDEAVEEEAVEFTEAEVKTLQELAVRRRDLDKREKEIDMRNGLLDAAEKKIEAKIAEMKKLQGVVEGLLNTYDEQEEANIKSLVKIYESMKPKDAAKIFEQLDMKILLDVISRMSGNKVAAVMSKMNPTKAKSVTAELALRRYLPRSNGELGG
ncbi:MAG: MotE family protein, partial [Nitrospinaceae bacterium]|nr:MotE family protein [Nitrospinaceae bacterium]